MVIQSKHIRFLWLCALVCASAAQAAIPLPEIAAELRQRLQPAPKYLTADRVALNLAEMDSRILPAPKNLKAGDVALRSSGAVARFYAGRGYAAAWLMAAEPSRQVSQLLTVLAEADRQGLISEDYHIRAINRALDAVGAANSVHQWTNLDLLLTDAFMTYGAHLSSGRFSPKRMGKDVGLEPRSRDLAPVLQTALETDRIAAALDDLSPPHPGYVRLQEALSRYRELALAGGWRQVSAGGKLHKGMRNRRVGELRARLAVTGEVGATAAAENLFDDALDQAVRRFQRRHGLREDGVVGPATLAALNIPVGERVRQIEMNLERWRWLPRDLGQRHIMVNITDYTMSVVEDGREVMGSKVIVGKPSRPTPVFAGEMSYLVLNPYWHVPPTIAVKDKLPKLRRNPYALSRQRIRVFAGGKEINPGRVNWRRVNARNLRYHFRQDPGPRNALGRIKFMFPNRYSVYLHDTPSKYLFNRDNRTFSSGCVRVADPIDLAEYLLSDSGWSRKAIVSKTRGKRQRRVNLSEKVPVYILYWTAWVDDAGETHFRRDIYEHDKRLAKAFRSEYKKLGLTLTAS